MEELLAPHFLFYLVTINKAIPPIIPITMVLI